MKTCSKCKTTKPLTEFTKTDSYCRPCRKEISTAYAKAHPDRLVAATLRWIERNREKFNAYQKELKSRPHVIEKKKAQMKRWYNSEKGKVWRDKNRPKKNIPMALRKRDKVAYKAHERAMSKKRRLANPEKYKDKGNKQYWKNIEHSRKKLRESYRRNRAKRITEQIAIRAARAGAKGNHSIAEWKSVLRHWKRHCAYCGIRLTNQNISRDHRIPLSRGGTNDIRNILPSCLSCNHRKHTMTDAEFIANRSVKRVNSNASVNAPSGLGQALHVTT